MKIPLAAAQACRVLGWFLGAALAPAFAQSDDHGNTAATATVINANTTTPGAINPGGDVDYFRFTLSYAARVILYTTGSTDTTGSLRNSGDGEITSDDDSGSYPNFRIERDLVPGTYYVKVTGFDASVTGSYVLNLEVDDGNTAATATAVAVNTRSAASLNSNTDIDYFQITLSAAARLVIYTTGGVDTIGSLRNSGDVEIVSNNDASLTDPNFRIERDLTAGTYYVRVSGQSGSTGAYVLHVETTGTATVTTAAASSITESAATLGGNVTGDGGAAVTERGVVYATSAGPLVGGTGVVAVSSGAGTGSFTVNVIGLSPGTTYYARAYAVNSTGTSYGADVQFLTLGSSPTTSNDDHGNTIATATLISPNSSTKGVLQSSGDLDYFRFVLPAPAEVFAITTGSVDTYGVLLDASGNVLQTNDNNGTNLNFRLAADLQPGTYYIVVTGAASASPYTLALQSVIRAYPPTVATGAPTGITTTTATFAGDVSSDGGASVTQRGVVYSTSPNPTVGAPGVVVLTSGSGTGAFTVAATGLATDTRYYVRAFAVNSGGTGYGDTVAFATNDDHGNTAGTASAVAVNTNISGTLTSAGDVDYFRFALTEPRYVAIFTTGAVDTAGSLRTTVDAEIASADTGGTGANFRIERSLEAGTYYVRVSGTGGALGSYTLRIETSTVPAVSTSAVADISPTGATLSGNVTSDGGTPVTQRGFVYGVAPNPTVGNASVVASGSGTGSFSATVTLIDSVTYYVRAFAVNSAGTAYGSEVQLTTPSGTRLSNLSIRGRAGDGEQALLIGFNLAGTGTKQLLLRGIGPTLASFGVAGALPDPFLQLFSPSTAIAANEDWGGVPAVAAAAASVGAFPLPLASKDAAMVQTLSAGSYGVRVGGGTGAALVELYDVGPIWTPELINVSTRAAIGTGADTLIAGFTIAGNGSRTVLVRAVGPTLSTFGVNGVVADPRFEVFRSGLATPVSSNDNWGGGAALAAAFERVGAFALPANSRDAAALLTLQAGSYTVQVSGVGTTTGVVLLEIYEMP